MTPFCSLGFDPFLFVFKDCVCVGGAVAERLFDHGLCLPSGSNLSESDLERVVEVVRRVFARR